MQGYGFQLLELLAYAQLVQGHPYKVPLQGGHGVSPCGYGRDITKPLKLPDHDFLKEKVNPSLSVRSSSSLPRLVGTTGYVVPNLLKSKACLTYRTSNTLAAACRWRKRFVKVKTVLVLFTL